MKAHKLRFALTDCGAFLERNYTNAALVAENGVNRTSFCDSMCLQRENNRIFA
jgi:hypothetical protein